MGQLSSAQISCLEKRLSSNEPLTKKTKVSKVLINNTQRKGDWGKLVKRHLSKYGQDDPNLVSAYAIYSYRNGSYREAIKWSARALEQKHLFKGGSDFKKKVYLLHQVRSVSASKLWKKAEDKVISDRSDKNIERAKRAKGQAKDFSREWLDYARASKQDTKMAAQLCISAADMTFCRQ